MTKGFLVFLLFLSCTLAVKLHRDERKEDNWKKLDVKKLNDDQKDVDNFIRDTISSMDGDLVAAASLDQLYRYVYKVGEDQNWDVQAKRDKDGNNEILVATRTQTYPDSKNPNITINKKTSILKKSLSDVIGSVL